MKIKNRLTILFVTLLLMMPITNINAASFSASASASTVSPGQRFNVNLSFAGEGRFSVTVSNGSGGNSSFWYPDVRSVGVVAGQSGSVTITVKAVDAVTTGEKSISGESTTIRVNIKQPYVESPAEKEARLKREQEARDKAEKEKKEAEEAKLKNTPLVTSIEIISDDLKRNGRLLNTIDTEFNNFNYSYELPSFIEKVKLNVSKLSDDVVVDFVSEQEIDGEKLVAIKASKGDISQTINLTLKTNSKEIKEVDGGIVYEDDLLNNKLNDLGFEALETENNGTIFAKKDFKFQMLMSDDRQVSFNRVNDNGTVIDSGIIFVSNDQVYYIVNSDDSEMTSKTLYNKSYSNIELKPTDFLLDIDESLTYSPIVKGWEFEEGYVVFAMGEDGESTLHHIDINNNVKSAVVAFDSNNSNTILTIGLLIVSSLLLITGISFALYSKKTKKQLRHLIIRSEHDDFY